MNISSSNKKKIPIYLKESREKPHPSTLSSCSSRDCSEQLNSERSQVVPTYSRCGINWLRAAAFSVTALTRSPKDFSEQHHPTHPQRWSSGGTRPLLGAALSIHPSIHPTCCPHRQIQTYLREHLQLGALSFLLLEISEAVLATPDRTFCAFRARHGAKPFGQNPKSRVHQIFEHILATSALIKSTSPRNAHPFTCPSQGLDAQLFDWLYWEQVV